MTLLRLLHALPTPLVIVLLVGISALLAIAGLLWVRRAVPLPVLDQNNEFQDLILVVILTFDRPLLGGPRLTPDAFQTPIEEANRLMQQ